MNLRSYFKVQNCSQDFGLKLLKLLVKLFLYSGFLSCETQTKIKFSKFKMVDMK